MELLSPAGSFEALISAIKAGADAVYIGGKQFGARAFSKNFTDEEIVEAIKYAHMYDVKLYVAINTLIYDSEVAAFLSYVKFLHKSGVDAVIMQDIGMIDLVRKTLPNLEIHISTQAHIHNLDGAKFLEKLGIKRTVLARETSIDEIKNIKANSNIDLEVFIAGALCISYSGNCLMSSLIGGRSGNRGMCAGTCRLPYDLIDSKGNHLNKDKYLLSTKDLSSLENIGELIDAGVASFKIEGRMKSAEYVFIITSIYRKAIDSYLKTGKVLIDDKDILNLKKVFTRGFTKGFLFNEKNNNLVNTKMPNHNGVEIGKVIDYKNGYAKIKLTSDLSINDGIRIGSDIGLIVTSIYKDSQVKEAYKGDTISLKVDPVKKDMPVLKTKDIKLINWISEELNKNYQKLKIEMIFKASLSHMSLELHYKDISIMVENSNVERSKNISITKEDIINKLSKLGDTPYKLDDIKIDIEDNLFINVKDLNSLRRDAIEKLNLAREKKVDYKEAEYKIDIPDFPHEKNINYKVGSIDIYNKLKDYHDIYVDDIDLYNKIDSYYILPRVNSSYSPMDKVIISDLGGLNVYNNPYTSCYMNVVNSYSVAFLHSLGVKKVCLSLEMTYEQVEFLIKTYEERYKHHPNLEVLVLGNIEAMISKFNILEYHNLSDGNYYLLSKFKNKYPIKIKNGKMIIYYDEKRIDNQDYFKIGVNNIRKDVENIEDLKLI